MPARWQEWNKAKKEMETEKAVKRSAVNEALGIVRGAQKASKENPNTMRCPMCGGVKFKTVSKGTQWSCRSCGKIVNKKDVGPA